MDIMYISTADQSIEKTSIADLSYMAKDLCIKNNKIYDPSDVFIYSDDDGMYVDVTICYTRHSKEL